MKKIAAVFVAAMVVGGAAWAQTIPGGGEGKNGIVNTGVSPTGSIDRRSSGGMFSSDVDGFINPRFYDAKIGSFLFAGVNISDDNKASDNKRLDFGFAKTVGDLYLAFYYGGTLVSATGINSPATSDPVDTPKTTTNNADWDSDFAVLLGISGMGIRLDAHVPTQSDRTSNKGKQGSVDVDNLVSHVTDGPSFAVTWGAQMGDLAPWARVGYKVGNIDLSDDKKVDQDTATAPGYVKITSGAAFELSGGAEYALAQGAVGGELNVGITLPSTYTDKKVPTGMDEQTAKSGGALGLGLSGYYSRTFDFGNGVKLGVSPTLGFALTSQSNSTDGTAGANLKYGDLYTTLDGKVDMGLTWQVGQKVALFGGTSVRAFDWTVASKTGKEQPASGVDKTTNKDSAWRFGGVVIDDPTIGMTFTPVQNVSVGLALNDFINGLFGNETNFTPGFDFTVSAKL